MISATSGWLASEHTARAMVSSSLRAGMIAETASGECMRWGDKKRLAPLRGEAYHIQRPPRRGLLASGSFTEYFRGVK
jgi:hypothetical protein